MEKTMLRNPSQRSISRTANPNDQSAIEHLEEMRKRLIRTLIAFRRNGGRLHLRREDLSLAGTRYGQATRSARSLRSHVGVYDHCGRCGRHRHTSHCRLSNMAVRAPAPDGTHRSAVPLIPVISVLFVAGICFGYFVLFPMVLEFMRVWPKGHSKRCTPRKNTSRS